MAAAMLMEEELQNSMATSEEDAEFEEDDELAGDMNADAYAANNQLHNGMAGAQSEGDEDEDEDDEEEEEEEEGDEEDLTDEDAEGEEDDEMADQPNVEEEDESEEDDEDGDEDGEGVGAVKIQPGLLEDDDEDAVSGSDEEEEEESAASADDDDESKDSTDAEVEVEWEPTAEEEEEPANPNRCIFCQQDEENDPSEEFELYLACGVCGDNAHRQCARNADALRSDEEAETWYCPDCVSNKLVPEPPAPEPEEPDPAARRISRDRVPGDLLPSQRGTIKPDSHSVFNQLIAPEDPMDGSRLLRKRKTSSADAEVESATTLRTRRDKDGSSHPNAIRADGHLPGVKDEMDIDQPNKVQPLTNGHGKKAESPISPRTSRSLRPKSSSSGHAPATILEKSTTTLKIVIHADPVELRHIDSLPPKPKKKHRATSRARSSAAPSGFVPSSYSQPFYSLHEKEVEELKSKPYGGILTETEANTELTLPGPLQREEFDKARQNAEEEWKARAAAAAEAAAASGVKKARKVSGPASQIEYIDFGPYQIDIWYAAPYPEEYSRNKALFICEFCLKYMESDIVAWRHKTKCPWKHPPGDEIYRDGNIMIFEVDGRKNPLYCQNLCLLAKLFLGSKTLYYDVEPFLFYVMTEFDELGCHFVGYFSKEKRPSSLNNVSCILVLPIHQRKGYGHLLIDFSYLLTRVEKKTGSPEKPLSDMGLVSYRNYWRLVLCYYLREFKPGDQIPSIKKISDDMGLTPDDVISALDALGVLIRDPVTGTYAMKLRTDYYRQVIQAHEAKGYAKLNQKGLIWTPYIMGRGNASAFEHAPPLNTVAPREEDEEDEDIPEDTKSNKRDFETFNGSTNGDTDSITASLGKLTTKTGETIKAGSSEGGTDGSESAPKTNGISKKLTYYEAAASIPATRFEVFPPVPGARRPTISRPSISRPAILPRSSLSTSSRPKPRRSIGSSSRRSGTVSRRTSTVRRKSGGTGRGPGRWPKGTKKSDFGNADSGPGLPPKLLKQRSKLGNEVLLGDEEEEEDNEEEEKNDSGDQDEEEDDEDEAIVSETPAMRKRRDRNAGQGMGKPAPTFGGKGGKTLGKGMGKPPTAAGKSLLVDEAEDEEMEDAPADEDMDAEGEDE